MNTIKLFAISTILGFGVVGGIHYAKATHPEWLAAVGLESQDYRDIREAMMAEGISPEVAKDTQFIEMKEVPGLPNRIGIRQPAYCGKLKYKDQTAPFGAYRDEFGMLIVSPRQLLSGYEALCNPNSDVGKFEKAAYDLQQSVELDE